MLVAANAVFQRGNVMGSCLVRGGLAGLALVCSSGAALAYGPMDCRDPWIAQAIFQVWHRMPYASTNVSDECNIMNYNHGSWRTYGELVGYVRAVVPQNAPPQPGFGSGFRQSLTVQPVTSVAPATFNSLPQRDYMGTRQVQLNGAWYVIASGGGNVIASGGGNFVGHTSTGGTLISTNGGNIISSDAASLIGHDGASVIASGGGNLIASGGGNITLYKSR
jgi:hypothetical protein